MEPTTLTGPSADPRPGRIRDALRTVIDPCCKDRGISVVDMGLLSGVSVDADGRADVEIMLTSGWCPFQVDLTAEIADAARGVEGVTGADVTITLDEVWTPARMAPEARSTLRMLPDPGDVVDRDAFVAAAPPPLVQITRKPAAAATPTRATTSGATR